MRPTNNPGLQRRIRETLYQLKLDHGVLCDVYKLVSSSTDYSTGEKSNSITRLSVRRGIKMPQNVARLQYISPNFTQTNKNFITKGLGWDEVTDLFLFDGRDLRGFEFDISDWIVWNHVRYNVKEFEELGEGAGWAVWTSLAKGEKTYEIFPVEVTSTMVIVDETGEELI